MASQDIRLTHPDRVLYSEQGLTKRDLADYYTAIAELMLPHVRGRILTLVRCPDGESGECFFQKHHKQGMPEAIRSVRIQERNKTADYMVIEDVLGLVALVQMGALEIHAWGARADRPERPDQLIFDLDPGPGVAWERVTEAAVTVHDRLLDLGLQSFVKTSGGKGLHVVAPIERRSDWNAVKDFAQALARALAADEPQKFVATASKAERQGRIFVDYLRNGRGATNVCPYSTRARPRAPVSAPLRWQELDAEPGPDRYDIRGIVARAMSLGSDPWAGYFDCRQAITKQMRQSLGVAA